MSLYQEKNVARLFVGNTALATVIPASGTTIKNVTDLTDGQIAIVNENNVTITTAPASTAKTRIVQRSGNDLIFSEYFTLSNLVSKSAVLYEEALPRIEYIGYNFTSGSLDEIDYNDYKVSIQLGNYFENMQNKPYEIFARYTSDGTATQLEVGNNLVKELAFNSSKWSEQPVIVELVTSGAVTEFTNANDHSYVQVTKGSKQIYVQTTGSAALTTATYISLHGGVYKIETVISAANGIYIMDKPWQRETGYVYCPTTATTITAATAGGHVRTMTTSAAHTIPTGAIVFFYCAAGARYTGIVTGASAITSYQDIAAGAGAGQAIDGNGTVVTTGNFGIKLESSRQSIYSVGNWNTPEFYTFSTMVSGFTASTTSISQNWTNGKGSYRAMANIEMQLQGNEGKKWRTGIPTPTFRQLTSSSSVLQAGRYHNVVSLNWQSDSLNDVIGQSAKSFGTIMISLDSYDVSNGDAAMVILATVFNAGTHTAPWHISIGENS